MKKLATALIGLMMALSAGASFAHPGGKDSNGCHHDHKTGGYHCH